MWIYGVVFSSDSINPLAVIGFLMLLGGIGWIVVLIRKKAKLTAKSQPYNPNIE